MVVILLLLSNDGQSLSVFRQPNFLIPISYATILGGMCTLIGTSTNLVVVDMIWMPDIRVWNVRVGQG